MMYAIRWPLAIVLISILFGTGMGAFFGAKEESVKTYLENELQKNELFSKVDESSEGQKAKEKLAQTKDKSWRYILRAHFHGGGIAALSLGLLLLLGHMTLSSGKRQLIGFGIAISGFLYPLFWLFSGLYGPSMGTGAAKQKFEMFAYAGALHVLLTLVVLFYVIRGNLVGKQKVQELT